MKVRSNKINLPKTAEELEEAGCDGKGTEADNRPDCAGGAAELEGEAKTS